MTTERSGSPAGTARLFYSVGSPYARIARMAVVELGLEDRIAGEETTLRDAASPLLAVNPVGRVPTLLLSDGTALTETTLVLAAIDGFAPSDRRLLPAAGDARAAAALGRPLGLLDGIAVWNRELRRPADERSPGVIALEQARAARVLDALEHDVAAGHYDEPTAAALALAAVLGYGERRHRVWPWRDGHPALLAWFAIAAERPSFVRTVPPLGGIGPDGADPLASATSR